ncbi:DUF2938 domain-containing protein [Donghicola sp. C2-DW-16]|uniref:DUF2938 domain-containing protein n=1 Tax=Donghicola mangrovi TaxID=2729614 RepID=A0ABX2PJX0_9RHOB|nr:DUF2938 domain-containing protein [Donghicola mangrovi]NVO29287.1 DUF2938 domain-containing protein [Donghicola mangrovi]
MNAVIEGVVMGLTATIVMDIWALVLRQVAGMPLPNWAMVGRWTGHLPRGTVFHDDIAASDPVANELALGWATHYVVGILYGVFFAVVAGAAWLAEPTFFPVWVYAILTIGAGWFLLQPGLGLGVALSKTPNPMKGRIMGLIAHTWFGIGLWLGALAA